MRANLNQGGITGLGIDVSETYAVTVSQGDDGQDAALDDVETGEL